VVVARNDLDHDGQHHNGLIPQPLPRGTTIAHKTGELHDTLNDVGVVYLNHEPYAIAVMATNLSTLDAGYHFIQGVSRIAYSELARFACGARRTTTRHAVRCRASGDAAASTSPNATCRCGPRRTSRLAPSRERTAAGRGPAAT